MPDRKRSLEMAAMSYDTKKVKKSLTEARKKAQKKNPQKSLYEQVTDKGINRGDLTQGQKRAIGEKARHKYMTEKRKGGKGAAGRAALRAGRVAQLQGSATAAMNELRTTQALRQAATKKKEDSPTPFKMVAASKENYSPTAFSNKDQATMGAFNYGMAADSALNFGPGDGKKRKLGTEGMTYEEKLAYYEKQKKAKSQPKPLIKMGMGQGRTTIKK